MIKILAGRFVDLSPEKRVEIAKRLLEWEDQNQPSKAFEPHSLASSGKRRKSLLEQFWNEVEKARGSGLEHLNPFAASDALKVS